MTDHIYLTYKEAAERFDTSRSKVTRAVKSGILVPETQKRNGRDILTIRLDHLQEWAVQEGLECPDVTTAVNREHPRCELLDGPGARLGTSLYMHLAPSRWMRIPARLLPSQIIPA